MTMVSPGQLRHVTDGPDPDVIEAMGLLWDVVGTELPHDVFVQVDGAFDVLGRPEEQSAETHRRVSFEAARTTTVIASRRLSAK
jgi:hypothetical protein